MDARYSRNVPALSPEECALLRGKTVAVIGCGGLGGYIAELLARIGIGKLRAVDGDVFEPSNLNRQVLSSPALLGTSKAEAAAARIAAVNPEVQTDACPVFLTEDNAASLISGCDAVMDALDNIEARKVLAKACEAAGIPYIFGAIQGWVGQSAISMPGDNLIEILYPEGTRISDKSVLSFTPAMCACMQVSLCVKLLTGRPVETGTVYYFDLLNQEFETIPMV